MKTEIEYNLFVKQPVEMVMEQVKKDAAEFNISADDFNRAVLNWVLDRINEGPLPDWLLSDLARFRQ